MVRQELAKLLKECRGDGGKELMGAVINSFYELEPNYADHYRKREAIEKAVTEIMVGNEQEEMRRKVFALGEMARSAVEEGGSSFTNLTALIEELRSFWS
ncbi:hypothetical protein M0R45_007726 [Rubus argutus]|uniref:Uncharacterized protein n=1 Tax=Rubus argutus TaxID=59490 RepID=A0AAW1Y004_RUBAR